MTTYLDGFLPEYDVAKAHVTTVRASVRQCWAALRELDAGRSPVIRALFGLRGLPRSALTFDGLQRLGFRVLAEDPPRAFVLGIIGRFWTVSGGLRQFDAATFGAFSEPGYAKAVWGFALEPDGGTTRLSTETRVGCLDPASRRRFRVYWLVVGPFSTLIRREVLRLVKRAAETRRAEEAPSG